MSSRENDIKALAIFNEARESHRFCCLSIYSDYDYCWEIKWVLADNGKHIQRRTQCHDTLWEAIRDFQQLTKNE